MFSTGDWTFGLEIWLPGIPNPIDIRGTDEASALLAEKWPVTFGSAFERALSTCAAVLDGTMPPDSAKRALIDAAEAVGIPWMDRVYHVPSRSDVAARSSSINYSH
ncbi:DUF982 domain-containing protein [Rhizobium grahamii]|uniref:DUF982 domain-containing protein n=1 Tax=Rhizobium grahamii CCGE 502 TaxID=990285 RepID=S3HSI8_9HYPH|nr:DUF982 domain-containing protein [Rhizobium grahamii]EPE96176.1 hypothetical protein RGCCGE502_21385 [Rhizobium grahamii CCGE 502]